MYLFDEASKIFSIEFSIRERSLVFSLYKSIISFIVKPAETQVQSLSRFISLLMLCVLFRSGENRTTMHKCYTFLIFMVLLLPSLGLSRYWFTHGFCCKIISPERACWFICVFKSSFISIKGLFCLLIYKFVCSSVLRQQYFWWCVRCCSSY